MKLRLKFNSYIYKTFRSKLTAGLALLPVSGKSRVPAPPPNMMEATALGSASGFSNTGT